MPYAFPQTSSGYTPNDIYQFSVFSALAAGFNVGKSRAEDLIKHGTDGIGVFENGCLMVLEDGKAYAIESNGDARPAAHHELLPFAMVTIFRPIREVRTVLRSMEDLTKLMSIANMDISPLGVGGTNSYMPFQVEGHFMHMAIDNGQGVQKCFANVRGTIFGFAVPEWMETVSGPRIHCHFLSEDTESEYKRVGGRVVEFKTCGEAVLSPAKSGRFHLGFPQNPIWEHLKLEKKEASNEHRAR